MSPKASKPTPAKQLADEAVNSGEGARQTNILSRLLKREPPPTHPSDTIPSTPPSTPPSTGSKTSLHQSAANVSPQRDFHKVANSITREAIPAGMFNGKAKQLYDCLYALTRGAITPTMTVRISRAELMKKSGIGAKTTLEQNLRRLVASGLVIIKTIGGLQGGNEYTVLLPEETTTPPSTPPSTGTSPPSPPSPPSGGQKLGGLAPLETRVPRYGVTVDSTDTSEAPKTFIKTIEKNDDDAPPHELREAERELTGKESASEYWKPLFELLATELRIAAARTTVSSAPAFLTEHLRRRLWKTDKKSIEREENPSPQTSLSSSEQIKDCPDCGGTGFYYPTGFEGGVAKCKHEKLQSK